MAPWICLRNRPSPMTGRLFSFGLVKMYYKWRQCSFQAQWSDCRLPFLACKNVVNVYSVQTLYGAEWGSRLQVLPESLLLPDPTTCVKLSLQTCWPSHSADEVLGQWEGCCIASCLRRGEIAQQAPLVAVSLAAPTWHQDQLHQLHPLAPRSAWAKSPSSLWTGSGHEAGMRDLCQITLHPCCPCLDSQLSGNPCSRTFSDLPTLPKPPEVCQLTYNPEQSQLMGFFMQTQATVLCEH